MKQPKSTYAHEEFYEEFSEAMRERFMQAIARGYSGEDSVEEAVEYAEAFLDEHPDVDFLYERLEGGRESFKKRLLVKMIIPDNNEEAYYKK